MISLEDEIGDIINKARFGAGYTISDLAEITSLGIYYLEEIESYKTLPKRAELDKLAKTLSLDPDKLAQIADNSWVPSPTDFSRENIIVKWLNIPYGNYFENCYILGCAKTNAAAVIDPGGSPSLILDTLSNCGLTMDAIIITHAHSDHTGAIKELVDAVPEAVLISSPVEHFPLPGGYSVRWKPINDGANIRIGDLSIIPLATPGHTAGSTCYYTDKICITGDTLFAGSIGRPVKPELYADMLACIKTRILSLPTETIILPGHGPATTVAEEIAHNPFF